MRRQDYKIQTILLICILGFFLSLLSSNLKEKESVFNFLEHKQTGLGYFPPLLFFGLLRYRKKKSLNLVD